MARTDTPATAQDGTGAGAGEKGLKKDALGFASSVVIGVASTAPGYSLAASLGLVVAVAGVGLAAPATLLVAFVPMLLIASAYYYMNRADPDCGTTFSWVTRAMGPYLGWMGGWAIIVADIIVMANLAQIAGLYTFLLVGWQGAADSTLAVTLVGVLWIAVMTAICIIGIELSARTQVGLLGAAASTQTTILPTARTSLSMARSQAMPASLGRIHPRFLTPDVSTALMGILSIAWYVGLTLVSENILFDSIAALGLMIAFYYGLTGFACTIYYRREVMRSAKTFLLIGVGPTLGGLILTGVFLKSCYDLAKPENSESGDSWLGLGPPLVIGLGFLLMGIVLMLAWRSAGHRRFFERKPELADPGLIAGAPAGRETA